MRQNDAGLTKIGHWQLQLYFSLVVITRRRSGLCVPRCAWPSASSVDAALKNVADNFHLAFRTAALLTAIPPPRSVCLPSLPIPASRRRNRLRRSQSPDLNSRSSGHLEAHQLVIGQPETATADSVTAAVGITATALPIGASEPVFSFGETTRFSWKRKPAEERRQLSLRQSGAQGQSPAHRRGLTVTAGSARVRGVIPASSAHSNRRADKGRPSLGHNAGDSWLFAYLDYWSGGITDGDIVAVAQPS